MIRPAPILIAATGLASMSLIAQGLSKGILPLLEISHHPIVNSTFTMQLMVLPISFIALGLTYFVDRENFRTFFRFKVKSDSDWNYIGPLVLISFTLGNAMLMAFSVSSKGGSFNSTFISLLPLVIFLSAANAWSEEIFSRFVLVAGLTGKMSSRSICILSGIMFGLPHFFGTPSGVFGVITSGFLGWLLAKSVTDTRSLYWALLIHFIQDVVIFGAGALIIAGGTH